ncbi:MAG TPA: lipopolysaccharide heptosyltransferase I [Casimicrobiaceae bacterium]|nr:lipopolysaccharide heptosyltransferase I [Casimicrobiaceae bacterium]
MSAVLVIRPSSLGDIVYALAIASDIRRHKPELAIDWVAERGFVPLIDMCPDIRRVVPFALRRWRQAPLSRMTWREIVAFRRALKTDRYAAILDLQEQIKGALIARAARGRRHGFDRRSVREPIATFAHDVHHRVPRNLHFVERCRNLAASALGYALNGPPRWHIVPPVAAPAIPERPYAVLLHATSRAEKLWPEEHWRALVAHFTGAGYATVLPWGTHSEEDRSRRLASGHDRAVVPPWLSLPEAAATLARADAVVGIDTGFTHLAAALGTPTVGLFLATDPTVHGVSCAGTHARDLGSEGNIPSVEIVIAATGALLRRRPHY